MNTTHNDLHPDTPQMEQSAAMDQTARGMRELSPADIKAVAGDPES